MGGIKVAMLAGALLLTACSGDDDDAVDTTSSTVRRTTTTQAQTDSTEPAIEPEAEPTYAFGFLAPGEGQLAPFVPSQEQALALAIEDINAAGGLLGGPVRSIRDDEVSDEPLETNLDALQAEGTNAIVGPIGSGSASLVVPLLAERQLLGCSASATAATVTSGNLASTFFRTALGDDAAAPVIANRVMAPANEEAPPPATVTVLGRDDIYGAELVGELAAHLTARGATVETILYPSYREQFEEEVGTVVAAPPDRVVLVSYDEGPTLVAQLVDAGYPVEQIVGLDGLSFPDVAAITFPDDPTRATGLTVVAQTGDRAFTQRLAAVLAPEDSTLYGAQMYDCAITIALAVLASGSADPVQVGGQIVEVTSGGSQCSTYAHCAELLAAGDDINYTGPSGPLDIDENGNVARGRLTTWVVESGELVEIATDEVDLLAERAEQLLAGAVFTARLQQALRLLGFYDGDINGVFDEATAEAVRSLQRELGVPETGAWDAETDAAFRARFGDAAALLSLSISDLQRELQALGYYDGPIDGRYSEATIAAVRAFQRDLGVPETGLLDLATLRAIYARGQQSVTPPEPPPPPPPTTAPPPPVTTAPPVVTTAPPPPPTTTTAPAPPTTEEPPPAEPTMLEVLAENGQFSRFLELATSVGFDRELAAPPRPFTLFAPTNDAFAAMSEDELERWQDELALPSLIAYHAVDADEGVLTNQDFRTGELRSQQGSLLNVEVAGAITVNGGQLGAQFGASNGIVHAVNTVLIPPA